MRLLKEELTHLFSPNGPLVKMPGFEYRPQQLSMALAVADALEAASHLIVEAPTGIGKSLAYLIPAILFARENKRKAIVSTHTKNLQEQLHRKDLEIVHSLLRDDFVAVVLKGRRNYLCTTRLKNALSRQGQFFEKDDTGELQRIREWAQKTSTGDIEELDPAPDQRVWQLVCSDNGTCSRLICGTDCFFQQAKERARKAHLVILNHALFFTLLPLLQTENRYLFNTDFVIFDEAHTLEQVAGLGIGKSLSRAQVLFAIHRIYNSKTRKGLLARQRLRAAHQLCGEVEITVNNFFQSADRAARSLGRSSTNVRVSVPHIIEDTVSRPLRSLQHFLRDLGEEGSLRVPEEEINSARHSLWEAETLISEFLHHTNPDLTYWIEMSSGRSSNVTLHTAPTDISESVGPLLFRANSSVIMTSATLSVNGSLDYFKRRVGATNARTLILDSPFDFRRQMRISLAPEIPSPDDSRFEEELPRWLLFAIERTQGHALVLFTSASLLARMAASLEKPLADRGLLLLSQLNSTSRHRLLERFKRERNAVLFGLDSFWMGIDVPGDALQHVIITRLPFAVPDHPLIESRVEKIAAHEGNAFYDFTLPEAVLKFRQGVGRLIRTRTDTGLVTVLDSRIMRKSYGRVFLSSIPRCPVEVLRSDGTRGEPYWEELETA